MADSETGKAERATLHFDVPRELRDVVARQARERFCSVSAHARFLIATAVELEATKQMERSR